MFLVKYFTINGKNTKIVFRKKVGSMTLQQLKYIVTIADKGKISEAASTLFISQPSLTNAVHEVETELGFEVFNRTNRGIALTDQGRKFLAYARQVVEQMSMLENTFLNESMPKQHFQVSAQHYSFVVNAFVELLKEYNFEEYDVTLRECRTAEIIDDVRNARSQLGVLYLSDFNEKLIRKTLKENHVTYHELFVASPHIFISAEHPLASKDLIELTDLEEYPRLSFEQGDANSFFFSEEILSTMTTKKAIRVSDRATLFNLLIGMNGYTISTGIISKDLNGENIISKKLNVKETIRVGYIMRSGEQLGSLAKRYIEILQVLTNNSLI